MKRLLVAFVLAAAIAVANGAGGLVPYNTGGGGGGGGGYYGGMNQPVRPKMGAPVVYGRPGGVKPPARPKSPQKPEPLVLQNMRKNLQKLPRPPIVPYRESPGGPDPHHHRRRLLGNVGKKNTKRGGSGRG